MRPDLKSWIAENILLGCDTNDLIPALISTGLSPEDARKAIDYSISHPFMHAAQRVQTTLKKREALLKTLDYYQRLDPSYTVLERQPLPPFRDFIRDYYARSRPGLFTGAFDHWKAREWTPRNLAERIGEDTIVELQVGRDTDTQYEVNSVKLRKEMRFGAFIDLVETTRTNDVYLTANNMALDKNSAFASLAGDVGDLGEHGGYLNQDVMSQRMFLWIGPAGTVTPLHHDNTHNMFIQIHGRKRFRLIPTMQAPYVYNHVGVFCAVDVLDPKPEQFPLYAKTTPIEIVVEPGDFLYIPMTWWHHVVAETPSISLSFTNVNAPNQIIDYPPDFRY